MYQLYINIKARREELGLSQEELAARLGYKTKSTISRIEHGQIDLTYSRILAFAEALETSEPALFGWPDYVMPKKKEHVRYETIAGSDKPDLKTAEETPYQANRKKKPK